MILSYKNDICLTHKLLEGVHQTIEFISVICSLYFGIEHKIIQNSLNIKYLLELESFISPQNTNTSIFVHLINDTDSNLPYTHASMCNILVTHTLDSNIHNISASVGFYKYYNNLKLSDIGNDEKQSNSNAGTKFILYPIFFNDKFPLASTLKGYLNSLLIPIYKHHYQISVNNTTTNYKYTNILKKLDEIAVIIEHIDDGTNIEYANFQMCKHLKSLFDPVTKTLNSYEIEIKNELVLEEIKSNVRDWSTEIVRIIREYLSKFSEDYDEEDSLSMSESSEYDSDATSGSSSPVESSFNTTFLTLKTSKIKHVDTKMMDDVTNYIEKICSNSIDLVEEANFWTSYQKVLTHLVEEMQSPNFINTLLLLEFNGMSVDNIYSFDESNRLVRQILIDVDETNSFMTSLNLGDLTNTSGLTDINLLIENIFINIKKYINIKYFKNDRIMLLFNGILAQIVSSISKTISLELKEIMFDDNHNLLIKTVRTLYELKNKILNLDKYFEKNKIQIKPSDNNLLILLDLYRDILQSFCKCNIKFSSLNSDINSLITYLSEDFDNIYDQTIYYYKAFINTKELNDKLVKGLADLSESYNSFISDINHHYSEISENMANILSLDDVIMTTKQNISAHENMFIECVKTYLYTLDLFEAIPIVDTIYCLNISKTHSLFGYKADNYIDSIIEEYDKILYDKNNLDKTIDYFSYKFSDETFLKSVIDQRIMNLLDVVDVLISISSKSILKTIQNRLNELINQIGYTDHDSLNTNSLNLQIKIIKKKNSYTLSLQSEIDYQKQISHLSYSSHSNHYTVFEYAINCMDFVDKMIKICMIISDEKIKYIDNDITFNNLFVDQFNWLNKSIAESIKENSNYLIHNGILSKAFFKFIKSLYDYTIITSLILGVYKRFNYLLKNDETRIEEYKDDIVSSLMYIDKLVPYLIKYNDIKAQSSCVDGVITSIIEKYTWCVTEEWAKDNITTINDRYCDVMFILRDGKLEIEPSISNIRKEYFSRITDILSQCNELSSIYTNYEPSFNRNIDSSKYFTVYMKLIDDELLELEAEFEHWSVLLSDCKINLIKDTNTQPDYNNIIDKLDKSIECVNNTSDYKLLNFIKIKLPKKEYIRKIEHIRKQTLEDIEYENNIHKINKYFKELQQTLEESMVEFKHEQQINDFSVYTISNLKSIYKLIGDNIIKLNLVKTSNYNETITKSSVGWIRELQKLKSFFDDCIVFIKKFTKLLKITSCKFINFNDHMGQINKLNDYFGKITSISKLAYVDDHYTTLISSMIDTVDLINHKIGNQLNDIRYICPRLYFIQDSDLIEIISNINIDIHIFKIFPGISFIVKNNSLVSGIVSIEGEKLEFEHKIECNGDNNVKFINDLDTSIKTHLKALFGQSLKDLNNFYFNYQLDGDLFMKWISTYPFQVLIVSLSLHWTESMESSYHYSNFDKLAGLTSSMVKFILVNVNSHDGYTQSKMCQLFYILNYQMNKIKDLRNEPINSLKWMKCIRYSREEGNIKLKIMNRAYNYEFDYLCNSQKIIITNVTEHFYFFTSLVLNCNLLPCAKGPAGTGKTETIKSLSFLAGSNMLVFNFSELYQVNDIEKILSGLCMLGFWGIFDEFNRLSECVLSSITETLEKISNPNNNEITLLDKRIDISSNNAFFITMNPGYSGRSELPLNCIHMCQQFAMEEINLLSILQANLQLQGFENHLELSNEVILLLDSFKLIHTSIEYDFGLRFMNYVFNFINYIKLNSKPAHMNNGYYDKEIFYQALNRLLFARMSLDEILLYKYITSNTKEVVYTDDENTFLEALKNNCLDEYLVSKSLQIYQMMKVSSSIILYGDSFSGKSLAFDRFIGCLRLKGDVELIVFDPNSISTTELYGFKIDDRWIEGLIPYFLKLPIDNHLFILFDGEIRQEWVENLNSLLDDNRILTLSNGERICLNDKIKLFFETDSFEYLTPATVSRSTIIKFENHPFHVQHDLLESENTILNDHDAINSLIMKSEPFVVKYERGSGITSYFKEIASKYTTHIMYLSKYIDSNDLINYLSTICVYDEKNGIIKSKYESNTVILFKDIYVFKDKYKSNSLYAILRQLVQHKFIYKYNFTKSKWDKVHLEGIVFVFFKSDEYNTKCRLLSKLNVVKLSQIINWDDKLAGLNEKTKKLYDNNDTFECETDRFFIKSDSILDSYQFISLYLHLNKSFLCLSGPSVCGKRFLSMLASSNIGLKFIDINDLSQNEIILLIIEAGVNESKFTFFINMDLFLLTKYKFYYIIKNLIYNEHSILFNDKMLNEISSNCSSNLPFCEFKDYFFNNISLNIRFILSRNEIEKSMVNRGIIYKMENLNRYELVSSSNNIVGIYNSVIADMYLMCKEFIGDRLIDFVFILKMTKHWNGILTERNNKVLKYLQQGIEKIDSFKSDLNHLEQELNSTKQKLNEKNIESEIKTKHLSEKQLECEERRKIALDLTESLNSRKSILDEKKNKVKYKIDNIKPMIEKAKQDVENINKRALEELKTMHNPPFIVKYTIETVLTVIQNKSVQWEETRKILKGTDFISKIVSYNIENMSEHMYDTLKERLKIPQWNIVRISKASRAAGPLAKWVNSIIECYEIQKQIVPLMKEVEQIEEETLKNENTLTEQISLINNLETEIETNRIDYTKSSEESIHITNEIEDTENKLILSKSIIEDLSNELTRWDDKINNIRNDNKCVMSNSIMESLMTIYVSLDYNTRNLFIGKCLQTFKDNGLDCSFSLDRITNIEKHVIENNEKFKHVIILDSEESEYLELIEEPFTQISASDDNFSEVLEDVKGSSGRLLIKNIHCCDTNVKNRLLTEFKSKLDYSSDFNFYIVSTNQFFKTNNESDSKIITSIYNRGLIINMKKDGKYLYHFVKQKLIEKLEPELHTSFINRNNDICKLNLEINSNETLMLDRLINSNIFDPKFIEFMSDYKKTTYRLDSELGILEKSYKEYYDSIESKTQQIELICNIHNEIGKLMNINKLYCFNFNIMFYFAISFKISESFELDIIVSSFNWINNAIFKSDKSIWGLSMLKILSRYNNELKECLNSIRNDYDLDSQNEINNLINSHLNSDRFDSLILDYYDTIILLTDGFQEPTSICESMCRKLNKKFDTYAVGSLSEMTKLKSSIVYSLKQGNCVLIKNIHLAQTWINKIETEFINKYKHTKIFLTCDINVELSTNMLLSCHKITCELSNLRSLITHLYHTFNTDFYESINFGFILLKCVFIYSVIFTRQLYIPYGWTANYNFNTNNLKMILEGSNFIFEVSTPPYAENKITDLNDLIIDICSAKISNYIDLKVLEDIVTVSNQQFNVYEQIELDKWLDKNVTDEFEIIGFTKFTQNEIFKSRNIQTNSRIEYNTKDIYTGYEISCNCKIFSKYFNDEIVEMRSKPMSNIDPEKHMKTLESINGLIRGEKSTDINLNSILFPNKLINLLKFPFSNRENVNPNEIELIVKIENKDHEQPVLSNEFNSFTTNIVLYNGSYIRDSNSIKTGNVNPELHRLNFLWIPKDEFRCGEAAAISLIPLYKSNGFVYIY